MLAARLQAALFMTMRQCDSAPAVQDQAYLTNMAISSHLRRQGLGRLMMQARAQGTLPTSHRRHAHTWAVLQAADELCRAAGQCHLTLHLRLKDDGAAALYESCGFRIAAQDSILLSFVGQDRRKLMVKHVPAPLAEARKPQNVEV